MRLTHYSSIVLLLTFGFGATGAATTSHWPSRAHDIVATADFPFNDKFVSTAWGICRTFGEFYRYDFLFKRIDIRTPHFEKPVEIPHVYQVDKRRNRIKAPLVFYLNGAFSSAEADNAKLIFNMLAYKGYHVISIHDPWGKDYIKSVPKHPLAHIEKEGEALLRIVKQRYYALKNAGLVEGRPSIIGLSHGAFLGTVVGALNAESDSPIDFKNITGFSPPVDLAETMRILDRALNNTEILYQETPLWRVGAFYGEICDLDDYDIPSEELKEHINMLTNWYGFQRALVKSLYRYEEEVGLKHGGPLPSGKGGPDQRAKKKAFKLSVRFEAVLKNHFPTSYEMNLSPKGNLFYWIQRGTNAGFNRYRYLAAKDDFLNHPDSWSAPIGIDLLFLEGGGHFGFRAKNWFDELVGVSF